MSSALSGALTSNSSCPGLYCVEATLYRQVVGTIVFIIVWPFVVLDIKWVPLGRPAAALLGGALMVMFTVVPQDQVFAILGEKRNLETLCLLIGLMLMSYYYDREGVLQRVTLWVFRKNKLFRSILWQVCVLTAILAAMLTNTVTCTLITPLLLKEHMAQRRSDKELTPLLLGIATSANIGSAATFFGNPQNAFITASSDGEVSLLVFFASSLPAALIALGVSLGLLYLCYFKTTCKKQDLLTSNNPSSNSGATESDYSSPHTPAEPQQELTPSYNLSVDPYLTCQATEERESLFSTDPSGRGFYYFDENFVHNSDSSSEVDTHLVSTSQEYGATQSSSQAPVLSGRKSRLQHRTIERTLSQTFLQEETFNEYLREQSSSPEVSLVGHEPEPQSGWRDKAFLIWLIVISAVLVALLAVPPRVTVHFNLGLVPVGAAVMTMLVDSIIKRRYALNAIERVDWNMIIMLVGLFVWIGGFRNTQFPAELFSSIKAYMGLSTVGGVLLFTVFVALGSNVLGSLPLVILMIDQLFSMYCGDGTLCSTQLTGMLLAWVTTVAGNLTMIGSMANLIVAEKAQSVSNHRLSFWQYLKFGFCSSLATLFVGLPVVYFTSKHIHI